MKRWVYNNSASPFVCQQQWLYRGPKSNLLKAFSVVSVWDFIISHTTYNISTQGSDDSALHLGLLGILNCVHRLGHGGGSARKCEVVFLLSQNGDTPKHTLISHRWQNRILANKCTVRVHARARACVLRKLGYIHITRDLRLALLIVFRMPSIFVTYTPN